MIFVKVNETILPASIEGRLVDKEWNNRESKFITIKSDYNTINNLFKEGTAWFITEEITVPAIDDNGEAILDEQGNPTFQTELLEFDNSDFNIRGDLIVHTNGTCTVKMGKETDTEKLLIMLYGGES